MADIAIAPVEGTPIPEVESAERGSVLVAAGDGLAPVWQSKPYIDVRDYDAEGDGVTDDSAAIRAALAELSSRGGGLLYFPEGTYLVSRHASNAWCLTLPSYVTLGGTAASILKMAADEPNSVRLLHVLQKTRVTIRDLILDGNESAPAGSIDQKHGVICADSTDIALVDVTFRNHGGDGVLIMGENGLCDSITLRHCLFDDCQRNGITLYDGYRNVHILGNHFTTSVAGAAIDSEPEAETNNGHVRVIGNYVPNRPAGTFAMEVGGVSHANRTTHWEITGNHFGGSVLLRLTEKVTLKGNYIRGTSDAGVHCDLTNLDAVIAGNTIESEDMPGIQVVPTFGGAQRRITIAGNAVSMTGETGAVEGAILVIGGPVEDIAITGNVVTGDGVDSVIGIHVFPASDDIENVSVTGNVVRGFDIGCVVQGTGGHIATRPVVTGNVLDCATPLFVATDCVDAVVGLNAPASSAAGWTQVAYTAGDFTAGGSQTWTVQSGDLTDFAYTKTGRTMTVMVVIQGSSVGGTPDAVLSVLIPGGFTSARVITVGCLVGDNGAYAPGYLTTSGTVILVRKSDLSNWTASTNNTLVGGSVTFETTT